MDNIEDTPKKLKEPVKSLEDVDKTIITSLAKKLEESETIEETREILKRVFFFLESILKMELTDDVTKIYSRMRKEGLMLRCESISRIFESIINRKPIHIGDKDDHYANAVIPELEGIKIAFAEARAPGPVKLIMAFDVRSLIGFSPENIKVETLEVSRVETDEMNPRDVNLRKNFCRHVSGDLLPQQIKYLILRIPRSVFPEEYLRENESEEIRFVFRGGKFPENL
jgi:hypothetical protein